MTGRPAAEQHLRDLALLRRVRDRIDREYSQPLDVEALALGAHCPPGTSAVSSGSPSGIEKHPPRAAA